MFLPAFTDSETERRAQLLLLILLMLVPSMIAITLMLLLLKGLGSTLVLTCGVLLVVLLGLLGLLRAGYVTSATVGLIAALSIANIAGASTPEFANIQSAYTAYGVSNGVVLLIAGFLLRWWSAVPVAIVVLSLQQIVGVALDTTLRIGFVAAVILLTFGLLVSLFARSLQFALQHARTQEAAAQAAAVQANDLNNELEARLRDTSTLLDQERHLRDTISQLTVPVQEIGERVLFAPLIGHIDSTRGQQVSDTILQKLHSSRAHTIIVDVQGVSTIDTNVARMLDQLIQAIQLLGARVMLTGISAQMAATITQLGISFRDIALYPSVSSALQATTIQRVDRNSSLHPSFS
ncbi:MAG TPA: STAS domain-containing protein [Herpetosiphonaceae bacterium]